jgi:hypothetical protein
MTWIWLSVVVVLVGAELDAKMERQTAVDTARGRPNPLGARGAVVADTVGEAGPDGAGRPSCRAIAAHRKQEKEPPAWLAGASASSWVRFGKSAPLKAVSERCGRSLNAAAGSCGGA